MQRSRGRRIALRSQHIVGRELSESPYDCVKKVDYLLMLLISWLIAGNIKCGGACRMFGELSHMPESITKQKGMGRLTSCAQKLEFGAPWLIQYLFTSKSK
jgi:hypothetical protein